MRKKVYFRRKREQVFLVFSANNRRLYVSCGVSLPDKYWEYNFVATNHPEYHLIYRILENYLRIAKAAIQLSTDYATTEDLRDKYRLLLEYEKPESIQIGVSKSACIFTTDFKRFIEKRKPLYRHLTIKKYFTTLNILFEFEEFSKIRLDISTFNKLVFEQFVSFLILQKNHLNNTVAKHVAVLKAFIRDTYPAFDTTFLVFREYRPEVIALSEKEFINLTKLELKGTKATARDLFVFLCLTGMRISDVKRFKPGWISDGFIEYSAAKTMSKALVPVMDITKQILDEYYGMPPKMCEQFLNRTIKKVFKDAGFDRPVVIRNRQGRNMIEEIHPLHEVVSSHTGRKTFVSMMLARGVPIHDVMNMSGHQDYRSMKPYIQIDREMMRKYALL